MASARGIWGSLTVSSGTHKIFGIFLSLQGDSSERRMTVVLAVAGDTPPPNPQIQSTLSSSCSWDETPKLYLKHTKSSLTMGRRLRRLRDRMKERRAKLFDNKARLMEAFGEDKPKVLTADVTMISGCEDHQTSADVSNVS